MSLKTLHKGRRGTWIYQSPRITLLLIYAKERGLDLGEVYRWHIEAVRRLGPHQKWILDRIKWLGYTSLRGSPPNLAAVEHYSKALGIDGVKIAEAIDAVLQALLSKPADAPLLPPVLTLPEKVLLVEMLAKSHFDLVGAMKELLGIRRSSLDRDTYRREMRFRKGWLYSLHMATEAGEPTCIGCAVVVRAELGRLADVYVEYLRRTGLLKWVVALEAAALDIGTKQELDRLVDAYRRFVALEEREIYPAFNYMASDVKDITMAMPAKSVEDILQELYRPC